MKTYYIEKDDKIVLHDQDKARLECTLKYTPQYDGLKIQETERPIENGEWADTPEYIAKKEKQEIANQVSTLEAQTGLVRSLREIVLSSELNVSEYISNKIQEIEALAQELRG